jgi:hypothetical protein
LTISVFRCVCDDKLIITGVYYAYVWKCTSFKKTGMGLLLMDADVQRDLYPMFPLGG